MVFKVIAEAKYEYEVEADDDELAITKALELFDESYGHFQDPASVLEWRAIRSGTPTTDMEKYKMVCLLIIKDPFLYSPESFELEIEQFNKANKDGMVVEVINVDKEGKGVSKSIPSK